MATAVYCRVSTDNLGQDTQNQLLQMPAHSLEYIDHASGKSTDRDAFQRMMADAEAHKFDELIFWSLDRLSREGISATFRILERLKELGIRARSIKEPWLDSQSPVNDVVIAVLAWSAKMERERLCDRVKAGMARVKANGTASGNPVGRPPLDMEKQCRMLRKQKLTVRQIAREVGVSKSYVARALA